MANEKWTYQIDCPGHWVSASHWGMFWVEPQVV